MFKQGLVSALISSICFQTSVIAESFDDLDFELPVVTSASRLSQSVLSSPSMVTVIDRDMIEASGFIEIADLLRLVPGFMVAHAAGDVPAVASHGEGWEYPTRLQMLINGRSTYTSALSAIDWSIIGIDIEDIDRIEVVHGPAASAYGSNSFAGAINIITKQPSLDDKGYLKYRYGSHQERYALLRHSGEINQFYYTLTASKRENGGHEEYIETRVDPGSNQERFFDDYRDDRDLNKFSFTGSYQLNEKNELWFNLGNVHGKAEMPNIEPDFETPTREPGFLERDRDIDAWHFNTTWSHKLTESSEIKANFFHNYYNTDDMTETALWSEILGVPADLLPFPDQRSEFGIRSYNANRTDFELQYSQVNDSGLQFMFGAGLRYDTMESDSAYPLKGEQSNMGKRFFGNIEIPLTERFTANLGGLYELNNIERPHFSPRASLNVKLTPQQSLRFAYSRAYRIPALYEKYVDSGLFLESGSVLSQLFSRDDDLRAEKITSWDMSYLGKSLTQPISWEIRLYKEEYRDTIGFVRDRAALDGRKYISNAASSDAYGVEGHITYRPSQSSFIRLHFNHGHLSGQRMHEINPVEFLDISASSPDKSYGLLASKTIDSWRFNAGYYHVGSINWEGGLIGDQVESYNRVDASISKSFNLSNSQSLILKLAGQNIFDEKYNEFSTDTDIAFDPRYYGSITLIHK